MKASLVVAAVLATGACSKVTYKNPQVAPTGARYETTGHFFLAALVGHKRIPVHAWCPAGVAEIQSKFSVLDVALHFVTGFIYTPRSYEIVCGGAP